MNRPTRHSSIRTKTNNVGEDSSSTGYLNLSECNNKLGLNDVYNTAALSDNQNEQLNQPANNNNHNFQTRFFYRPIICVHCRDYIWGAGFIGYGCYKCAECVHFKCLIFVNNKTDCKNNMSVDSPENLDKLTKANLYPIENWSTDLVKQWLAVVNLHRYAEVFSKYKITGSKLLTINTEQLNEYRIRDSYHHKAILECCKELLVKSRQYSNSAQITREQHEFLNHLRTNPYKASKHHFLLHTISIQTNCHMCLRPFLGIVHQALLCQECGILVHRQCSCNGLPNCQVGITRPHTHKTKQYLFGVSLFDLNNDEESGVPLLLVKSFKHIEERAVETLEDLYDAYRLSSDTLKIDKIKQQLNENGIELTRFEGYDLNTICAIIKAFLRDLQNSVISEEIYLNLISSIQNISSTDLAKLIKNQLHPQHYACLKYIMAHLIRVWSYQYKTRGCHYLPDKIFHIFRSILLRPAWHNIIEIVNNIDKQTLVIQRLMLECDWGEELPDYKTRPKRSMSTRSNKSDSSSSTSTISHLPNLVQFASKIIPGVKPLVKYRSETKLNSIDNQEWYWANIVNRDNTNLILKSCPNGSFIVRNSTDKNPQAPYTLCVMKGTFVKSIKIFKQDTSSSTDSNGNESSYHPTFYDIEKPCRFESVQALIDYYSRLSLKEYNHNLDLKLTYGVSKFKFGRASEWSIDKLYTSFKEALDKHELLTKNCDNLESDLSIIRDDITQKRVACDAFDKIIIIFENQLEKANSVLTTNMLKKSNTTSVSALLATQFMPANRNNNNEIEKILRKNKSQLESKIMNLRQKKQDVIESIDYLNLNLSELQEKLDSLRPELIELRKKRENYHMWLLQRGENEDKIQTVIEPARNNKANEDNTSNTSYGNEYIKMKSSNSMSNLNEIVDTNTNLDEPKEEIQKEKRVFDSSNDIHSDSLNWFRADYTREKSEEKLKEKPLGTYLIRTSAYAGSKYVLSVMSQNNQIIHIIIDESKNKYFLKSQNKNQRLFDGHFQGEKDRSISPSIPNSASGSSVLSSGDLSNSSSSIGSSCDDIKNLKREFVNKFETLTDLVVFYSKNMLQIGNKTWNIRLKIPAFCEDIAAF